MSDFLDETLMWRRCERAWAKSLEVQDYAVFLAADAGQGKAPLLVVHGVPRRSPDISTVKHGSTAYWEVKFRSRADIDLTGAREYWIDYLAFRDYLAVAEGTGCPVYIPLYEGANAGNVGQWFRTDIYGIRNFGREGLKFTSGGEQVRAWIWPRSIMDRVDGPQVDSVGAHEPLLPDEGDKPEIPHQEFVQFERSLRRSKRNEQDAVLPVGDATKASPAFNIIREDSEVALDTLRRRLGLKHQPNYSVTRIGLGDLDINEVLGFLHYGIRVFLITEELIQTSYETDELDAFKDSRLLEWAVVPNLGKTAVWIVDGKFESETDSGALHALEAADISGGINFKQYKIVHAPSGADVVVAAGAGTGKTETMSERIVFLLATNGCLGQREGDLSVPDLRLDDMVLVTFTKEAAKEMRSRIARTLSLRQRLCTRCVLPTLQWMMQLSSTEITTIHTYAQKLIQQGGSSIGLSPSFSVSNRLMDFRRLMHQILSPYLSDLYENEPRNTPPSHEWQKHIQQLWDALSNNGVDLISFSPGGQRSQVDWGITKGSSLNQQVSTVTSKAMESLAIKFAEYCLENQIVPVGQLVPTALEAMRKKPLPLFKAPQYLFVDEFQDTDAQQMDMILDIKELLSALLFVVGDVKQGIYRFRGAEGSAFKELADRQLARNLPNFLKFSLNRNFRSAENLLNSMQPYFEKWGKTPSDELGKVMLLDYARSQDELLPDPFKKGSSEKVTLQTVDKSQNSLLAANQVAAWRKQHPDANIAVICRVNREAKEIQKRIIALGGSCDLIVGGDFYRTPAVRDLRVFLQAILDPTDTAALLELAETRWMPGIVDPHSGRELTGTFGEKWGDEKFELHAWSQRFSELVQTGNFNRDDLEVFVTRLKILREMADAVPLMAWIVECDRVFEPGGSAFQALGATVETEQEARNRRHYIRCLDHLMTLLDIEFADQPLSIVQLLSWLSLQIATNESEDEPFPASDETGRTVALTVHKAKGLEYDFVLVPSTWRRFETSYRQGTSAAVLRGQNGVTKILWEWRVEGNDPYTNTEQKDQGLWAVDTAESHREETRLLYVAMTRAKQKLVLYIPENDTSRNSSKVSSWSDLLKMVG